MADYFEHIGNKIMENTDPKYFMEGNKVFNYSDGTQAFEIYGNRIYGEGGGGGGTGSAIAEIMHVFAAGTSSTTSGTIPIGCIVSSDGTPTTFRYQPSVAVEGEYIRLYNNRFVAKVPGKYLFVTYFNSSGTAMIVDANTIEAVRGSSLGGISSEGRNGTGNMVIYLGTADNLITYKKLIDNVQISDTTHYLFPVELTDSINNYKYLLFELSYNNVKYYSCSVPANSINIASDSQTVTLTFDGNTISNIHYGGAYKNYYLTIKGIK